MRDFQTTSRRELFPSGAAAALATFLGNKHHALLGEGVSRAVSSGNLFAGPAQIQNKSPNDVRIRWNAASS